MEELCICAAIHIDVDSDLKLLIPVTEDNKCLVCGKRLEIVNLFSIEPRQCLCRVPQINSFWYCLYCRGAVYDEGGLMRPETTIHLCRALRLAIIIDEKYMAAMSHIIYNIGQFE